MHKPDSIKSYVKALLVGYGVPSHKANITAEVLVEADMRGIFSHGINSLDLIVINSIKQGGTDPNAKAEDKTRNPGYPIRHVDAHGDLGHSIAYEAVDMVKRLARKHGYGKIYVSNSNHFGIGAIYTEMICTEKDLSGRVTCTTPSVVKPYGGEKKRLGTNVIAWSIPYERGFITIDMATTIHAVSGVLRALIEKTPLPFPVYGPGGSKTTDPHEFDGFADFLERGSMIPLGGMGQEGADAGYKGTGLAMLIDLDNVLGGGVSTSIEPLAEDAKRRIRQTFEAWRIDTLYEQKEVLAHISKTISDMKSHQGEDMLLPGEKELIQREKSIKNGIPYTSVQIARLEKLGQSIGLGQVS
ncbi:MAG: Ldh family oxidoreductase [Candidatus Aminicenantes bacterium]|nr:MAG: Ldh family oxidoreductase [Candidatus Aminicenantes bacterium]